MLEIGMYIFQHHVRGEKPRIERTTALYMMDAYRCDFGSIEESFKTWYFVNGESCLYIKHPKYGGMISRTDFAIPKHNSSISWYPEIRNK